MTVGAIMRKIPISGGPHTGKTTLFNALRDEFPDAHFLSEPAGIVMDREMKKEQRNRRVLRGLPVEQLPRICKAGNQPIGRAGRKYPSWHRLWCSRTGA